MIELEEPFAVYSDAADKASLIALSGLKVCMTPDCMTFIPLAQISSVSVEDTEHKFVPNATIIPLDDLEKQIAATEPQGN